MIHIIPTDKFTSNILCLLIRRPLLRAEVTKTALLPALLQRACARYPTIRDMRLAVESLQGGIFDAQIVKKGEQQILQFFLECVDCGEEPINFLQEVVFNPRFDEASVKGEVENLKNRIEGRINNKGDYVKLKCLEFMCQDEPFGIYGDGYVEDLPHIENLHEHYNNILAESPMELIAFGRWDKAHLPKLDKKAELPKPKILPARSQRQVIQLDHGSAQGNLCIGLRADIPSVGMDFIHFQLANEILGGGPNSKLFANIREKESLCYSIYSTIFRFKSIMCILAGTEPDKLERVMELCEAEIHNLKRGEFDLDGAKLSLSKRWRVMQDRPSACVDFYASQYLLGDPYSLDELLLQVKEATHEGVVSVASRLNIDTVVMMR